MPTQQVHYRNGLASFRIPAHWQIEIDPVADGEFFDPRGTGTLRLSVMTFQGPGGWKMPALTRSSDERLVDRSVLPNGCELVVTDIDAVEDDVPIRIRSWIFYQVRLPVVHSYVFTYTHDWSDVGAPALLVQLDHDLRMMTPCPDCPQCLP